MMRKLFSSESKTITGAAIILGAASFVSRVIGLVRDRIFAHYFGAGDVLDAYYAAFRIPDLVYNLLIVGALSAGFIPIFIEVYTRNKEEAWKVTNTILNILLILLIVVCGICICITPYIIEIVAPGFEGEKRELAVLMTRIMFVSPVLLGVSSLVSGVLQSFKNFLIYSISPILYNIGIIIGALYIVPSIGYSGLAVGVVLGAILHLVIQFPSLVHYGFRYAPIIAWKDQAVIKIGKLIIPRTIGLATQQINFLIVTGIASLLPAGSLAVFNLAHNLQNAPIGIIAYSFTIAAFPTLAALAAQKQWDELGSTVTNTVKNILFFMVPITIVLLLLRAQTVRLVLGTGKFNWDATVQTADALAFFALSIGVQSLITLMARAFHALQDTWTPFIISVATTVINIALSWYLKDILGVSGLALAFSVSAILDFALLWATLRRKISTVDERGILMSLLKISIAGLFMAITIQISKYPLASMVDMTRFWGILVQAGVVATVGIAVYLIVCKMLKLEEMKQLEQSLERRWMKLWHVPREINKIED